MSMNKTIQDKVIKIASNKAVNNKVKIAVRKRFYELKNKELDLESIQEDFALETSTFESELDQILKTLASVPEVTDVDTIVKKAPVEQPTVLDDDSMDEEIILPKKPQVVSGMKVKMQEEVDTSSEEDTDFEVPFEAEEK